MSYITNLHLFSLLNVPSFLHADVTFATAKTMNSLKKKKASSGVKHAKLKKKANNEALPDGSWNKNRVCGSHRECIQLTSTCNDVNDYQLSCEFSDNNKKVCTYWYALRLLSHA